jgi:hypothetical protein
MDLLTLGTSPNSKLSGSTSQEARLLAKSAWPGRAVRREVMDRLWAGYGPSVIANKNSRNSLIYRMSSSPHGLFDLHGPSVIWTRTIRQTPSPKTNHTWIIRRDIRTHDEHATNWEPMDRPYGADGPSVGFADRELEHSRESTQTSPSRISQMAGWIEPKF